MLAENEADLQTLLNIVCSWCAKWRLEVNLQKTNVMHVRRPGRSRTKTRFMFGNCEVPFCEEYKYLGITIHETLNFQKSVDHLAESASRALGSLVTKMIKNGGFPLKVYSKLYDSCVCSISDYGSEVLGYSEYTSLERIHSRAIRAFLGVPKSTPIAGMRAELGWIEPRSRTQMSLIRFYHRLINLPDERITKRVFMWDLRMTNSNPDISTWSKEVKAVLEENNLLGTFALNPFNLPLIISNLKSSMMQRDEEKLLNTCKSLPKLRTYCSLVGDPGWRNYLAKPLSFIQRKFMAKLRLGVLPLRIETGRYEMPRIESKDRICKQCAMQEVEDEEHFLLRCSKHSARRIALLSDIKLDNFGQWDSNQKLVYLLNDSSMLKATARFIIESFEERHIP